MIAAFLRWLHGDTAVDRRIALLEAEITALEAKLTVARKIADINRDAHIKRLRACGNCPTCITTGDPE